MGDWRYIYDNGTQKFLCKAFLAEKEEIILSQLVVLNPRIVPCVVS